MGAMSKATKRAKTAAGAQGKKPARKAAKKSVEVRDLPAANVVKAGATRRIVSRRVVVSGLGPPALASASGEHMAKTKKKAKAPKARKGAQSRKAAKKPVAVKDLKAKIAKSMKAGMTAVRRRLA